MPNTNEKICEICGKVLKGGNPSFHIRSKRHQDALIALGQVKDTQPIAKVDLPDPVVKPTPIPMIKTTPVHTTVPTPQIALKGATPQNEIKNKQDEEEFDGYLTF